MGRNECNVWAPKDVASVMQEPLTLDDATPQEQHRAMLRQHREEGDKRANRQLCNEHVDRRPTRSADATCESRKLPEGASPKQQIPTEPPRNKPFYSLVCRDIDVPLPKELKPRDTNPVEPQYSWYPPEDAPSEESRFLRDTLDLCDIEGASPQWSKAWSAFSSSATKNIENRASEASQRSKRWHGVGDAESSRYEIVPASKSEPETQSQRMKQVSTIGALDRRDRMYDVADITGRKADWQRPNTKATSDLDFAQPRPRRHVQPADFRLHVGDIEGASPTYQSVFHDPLKQRKHVREVNSTAGIDGAHASHVHGAQAQRMRREATRKNDPPSRESKEAAISRVMESGTGMKLWRELQAIDRENSGKLTRDELQRVFQRAGVESVTDADIGVLAQVYDTESTGHFNRNAFARDVATRKEMSKQREDQALQEQMKREANAAAADRLHRAWTAADYYKGQLRSPKRRIKAENWSKSSLIGNVPVGQQAENIKGRRRNPSAYTYGMQAKEALTNAPTDVLANWRPSQDAQIKYGLAKLSSSEVAPEEHGKRKQGHRQQREGTLFYERPYSAPVEAKRASGVADTVSDEKAEEIESVRNLEY